MIRLWVLLAGAFLSCLLSGCRGCQREANLPTQDKPDYSGITVDRILPTDLKVGTGATVSATATVLVNYDGWIYDPAKPENRGSTFGSSHDGKFAVALGKGQVVPGWEQGMVGMKEGGKRRLIIPIELGYGRKGSANIPPDSILLIEVEVLKVQ